MRHTMVETMTSGRTMHGTHTGGDNNFMEDKTWDTQWWRQ